LITALYRAGLRVSEALGLEPHDLDARNRIVFVRRASVTRKVGLDAGSFRIIERWVERRDEISTPRGAPLFCTLSGKPLSSSYLRGMFRRLATNAGIEKRVSAEVLRRSFATELASEGFPLLAIQAQLGHSNLGATLRYLDRIETIDVLDVQRDRQDWVP
jgi:integrase/recombinase XerC